MAVRILIGDARAMLKTLPSESVHCVVTSPPYFGLRDYGTAAWEGGDPACEHIVGEIRTDLGLAKLGERYAGGGHKAALPKPMIAKGECPHCGAKRVDQQMGSEPSLGEYIAGMVELFREVRRVLRPDGTLWLNIGDSYAGSRCAPQGNSGDMRDRSIASQRERRAESGSHQARPGAKPKDLLMVPARLAIALLDDGWWVRKDIIWHKPNPMPESCTDRPTSSHEHVFLLTKAERYFFDGEAVREQSRGTTPGELDGGPQRLPDGSNANKGRNFRPQENAKTFRGGSYVGGEPGKRQVVGNTKIKVPGGWDRGEGAHGTVHRDGRTSAEYQEASVRAGRNIRDVWTIATEAFPEAHFATFPTRLPELCIKAGTSEHGCCACCGAPWRRIVEKGAPDLEAQRASGGDAVGEYHGQSTKDHAAAGVQDASAVKARILAGMRERSTAGWEPTCECSGEPEIVPCTVLDPFLGAGTTALVADRLGRNAIGIELNPEYAAMAQRRIEGDAGMFAEVASCA